jgi:hypothetical protein
VFLLFEFGAGMPECHLVDIFGEEVRVELGLFNNRGCEVAAFLEFVMVTVGFLVAREMR